MDVKKSVRVSVFVSLLFGGAILLYLYQTKALAVTGNTLEQTPLLENGVTEGTSQNTLGKSPEEGSFVERVIQRLTQDEAERKAGPVEAGERLTNSIIHTTIHTTLFWAGEEADDDNKDISNLPSAWDDAWVVNFGGVDKPKKRDGFLPGDFTPKENPFYFALPYNDFGKNGKRKKEAMTVIPWATQKEWKKEESMLKNQWIQITKGDKVAYAQWEDVGPFGEDDAAYVFGNAEPKSKTNKHAGLDVSPAVHDALGLTDLDTVDWQFVSVDAVPDGPWKQIITTSQINWK